MGKKKRPIIIDTDPGIDDALALAIALTHTELEVLLLTTVAGNVSVDKTTQNTLKLVSFFDKKVPVAKGCERPLLKPLTNATEIHGESGLDGYEFPEVTAQLSKLSAVEAMRQVILAHDEPVTLVPLAALTNIALLFSLYPETKQNIKEIVMMGGSLSGGNTTTAAEFNIYVDPHAAQMVFQSGVPLTMIGLDVTDQAILTKKETDQIKNFGEMGKMFYGLFHHYRGGSLQTGLKMHDVCAIAYLTNPELFTVQKNYIEVATEGPAAGATVADLERTYHETTNATVGLAINVSAFQEWVLTNLAKLA